MKADELAEFIGRYENGELVGEKETYTVTLENGKEIAGSIGIKVVFTPGQRFICIN